jgi:hypothetical protein
LLLIMGDDVLEIMYGRFGQSYFQSFGSRRRLTSESSSSRPDSKSDKP